MDDKPLRINNEIDEVIDEVISEEKDLKDAVSEDLTEDRAPKDEALEDIEASLRQQLEESKAKADEYLDGWQRARAEFANARKRLEKQRSESYQYASLDFSRRLLPVIDDFNRAFNSVPDGIAEDKWFEGISLVKKKLDSVLEDMKVETIEAVGQPFDPNFHEALSLVEADGFESGTVVAELQTGYRMGDIVVRPTLVNVAA